MVIARQWSTTWSLSLCGIGLLFVLPTPLMGPNPGAFIGVALILYGFISWILNRIFDTLTLKSALIALMVGFFCTALGLTSGRLEGDGTYIFAPSLIAIPGIAQFLDYGALLIWWKFGRTRE